MQRLFNDGTIDCSFENYILLMRSSETSHNGYILRLTGQLIVVLKTTYYTCEVRKLRTTGYMSGIFDVIVNKEEQTVLILLEPEATKLINN